MGNIFTSSIGKKLIMSITGAFLFLFLTFHLVMNSVLMFSDEMYNTIAGFLGANWYALAGTVILALGVLIHFIYAVILTLQNRKARGKIRYAETKRSEGVEWSSKNMLVLGFVIIIGLLLHLYHFWWNMQLTEILGNDINQYGLGPHDGAAIVRMRFSNIIYVIVYLVWFIGLWFHLTHGMWSMMHTVGWNSKVWMKRMKWISYIIATIIVGGYAVVAVTLYVQSLL